MQLGAGVHRLPAKITLRVIAMRDHFGDPLGRVCWGSDWMTKRTRGSSQSRDHNSLEDICRALFIDLLVQVKV
jgi:hypothetical protein